MLFENAILENLPEDARGAFVLAASKQTLVEMIGQAIGQQLGETVSL